MRLRRDYRAHLRADFRQYYGVSFDGALRESVVETADLVYMLPRGSRTYTALDPEYAWTQEDYLLANIANSLALLVWAQTKDGQKNRNRPKPITPPQKPKPETRKYTTDEYLRILSQPREEV